MKRFLLPLLLTWPGAALAAQPAPQLALAQDLQLTFKGELKKIDDGQLVTAPVTKSWTLPAKWVARSREYNKLSSYLTPYLDRVEKETFVRGRPAKFEQVGNKWVATDQPEWKLDRPATEAKLLEAIRTGATTLPVVFSEKVPQRSVALLAERGVMRNLASARSSFTGSPDFRVKNIVVGSSKLDYQWVAPGEDFDFNKSMGDINAANGFVPGYIISAGAGRRRRHLPGQHHHFPRPLGSGPAHRRAQPALLPRPLLRPGGLRGDGVRPQQEPADEERHRCLHLHSGELEHGDPETTLRRVWP